MASFSILSIFKIGVGPSSSHNRAYGSWSEILRVVKRRFRAGYARSNHLAWLISFNR